jgi:hypothetical protein
MEEKKERKRPSRRGKRNPIKGVAAMLVPFALPLIMGGALGALDAKAPAWWAKLSGKAKALVLVALAVVFRRKKQLEMFGACLAMAGRYLGESFAGGSHAAAPTDQALKDAADEELAAMYAQDVADIDDDVADIDDEAYQASPALAALAHDPDLGAVYQELSDVEEEYADAA